MRTQTYNNNVKRDEVDMDSIANSEKTTSKNSFDHKKKKEKEKKGSTLIGIF